LAAAHTVGVAAPVELRTTFAESQDRTVAEGEGQSIALGVDSELLYEPSFRHQTHGHGIGPHLD
jgi:hypothetical protein